jgi:hypothetical protein
MENTVRGRTALAFGRHYPDRIGDEICAVNPGQTAIIPPSTRRCCDTLDTANLNLSVT